MEDAPVTSFAAIVTAPFTTNSAAASKTCPMAEVIVTVVVAPL